MIVFSNIKCAKRYPACNDKYCSNRGTCYRIPYVIYPACQCKKGWTGARCQKKFRVRAVKDILNMMVKVPRIDDVYFKLQDLQNLTSVSFLKTQDMIETMEAKLQKSISTMKSHLGSMVEFNQLISKYYADVNQLNHALDIFKTKRDEYFYVSREAWAKQVLHHGNMGKWLKSYDVMMTGKDEVFGGDPLIIQLMKKGYYPFTIIYSITA